MKKLGYALLVAAVFVAGCGDDKKGGNGDAGPGGGGSDAGPRADGGGGGGRDSGPGGPMTCGGAACNLLDGTGCGTDESCYYLSASEGADPSAVCQASGAGTDGAACTSFTDCAAGYTCLQASAGAAGKCRHYCCRGSDNGCPTDTTCSVAIGGTGSTVGLCKGADTCDPIAQTGCSTGENCYVMLPSGAGNCFAASREGNEGDTCMFVNECRRGLECLPTGNGMETKCYKFCDSMATTSGCGAAQTCMNLGVSSRPNLGRCVNGGVDAGTGGGVDAGTTGTDAGVADTDAGVTGTDAGVAG